MIVGFILATTPGARLAANVAERFTPGLALESVSGTLLTGVQLAEVRYASETLDAELASVPTGNIKGTAIEANSGTLLANICVYLYPHGNSAAASYATCTTSNGTYEIDGVTAGSYDVAFADPPYDFDEWQGLLEAIEPKIAAGGEVAIEHSARVALPQRARSLERFESRRYGDSAVSFYRRRGPASG